MNDVRSTWGRSGTLGLFKFDRNIRFGFRGTTVVGLAECRHCFRRPQVIEKMKCIETGRWLRMTKLHAKQGTSTAAPLSRRFIFPCIEAIK
jgi:hypothetical protein